MTWQKLGARAFPILISSTIVQNFSIVMNFFFNLVELLIKEPTNAFLDYFKYFDKLEIMVMISLEKYELRRDLLKKISISYIEAINFAKVLFKKNSFKSMKGSCCPIRCR